MQQQRSVWCRVLQNQEVQRVGSPLAKKVDVRVVAATNRDLRAMVAEKSFREDLYYRLATVEVKLPPLAERREDLPFLQRHFVERFAPQYQKPISGITRRAQALLARYHWPGNVRELENAIGSACMFARGNVIDIADLPESLRSGTTEIAAHPQEDLECLETIQRRHVLRVLERLNGDKGRAAEVLGIGRSTLYSILGKINASRKNIEPEPTTRPLKSSI